MIRKHGLLLLKQVAETFAAETRHKPWPALSLSYQDVLLTAEEYAAVFGATGLPVRPDSAAILKWHKAEAAFVPVPDWHEVLRHYGFDPTSTDLVRSRGCEEFLDLNQPLPARRRDRYDLVLDNVCHHCFDAAQALKNTAAAVRTGGYVLHVTPLSFANHGFYAFGPTLLHDFYTANGFETAAHGWFLANRDGPVGDLVRIDDPTRGMKDVPSPSMQLYLARRVKRVRPTVVPTQTKFVRHPMSLPD